MPAAGTRSDPWGELVRKIRALPENAMRRQVLIEHFHRLEPEETLDFLRSLLEATGRRRRASIEVLGAVHEAVLAAQRQGPLYELLAEVYRLAVEAGHEGVQGLLMAARPQRGPLSAKEVPGDLELSRLTLGERKFLARGRNRFRLDRLLYDPEPSVLCNLLQNPRLVEQDVVRLAARRPTREEIQHEIHRSRWCERYRVKLALVCNPYTPTEIAVKLLSFLLRADLRMVRRDEALHPLVRAEAKRLLGGTGR